MSMSKRARPEDLGRRLDDATRARLDGSHVASACALSVSEAPPREPPASDPAEEPRPAPVPA